MNDLLLARIAKHFSGISSELALASALLVIKWFQAGVRGKLPKPLTMKELKLSKRQMLQQLSELAHGPGDLAELFRLFQVNGSFPEQWVPALVGAVAECDDIVDEGGKDELLHYDLTKALLNADNGTPHFPAELYDLIVQLAGRLLEKRVYLPWDPGWQLTRRIAKVGHACKLQVEAVNPESRFPRLLAAFLASRLSLVSEAANPLRPIEHIKESLYSGKLEHADVTLAMPPLDTQQEWSETGGEDRRGTENKKTRSVGAMLADRLLLRTSDRIVLLTTNSLLFSSGPEADLRRRLLTEHTLDSVIALPAGLLDNTLVPLNILLIREGRWIGKGPNKEVRTVRFINADVPRFRNEISRTRVRLDNVDQLAEIALGGAIGAEDEEAVLDVPVDVILHNNSLLQFNRYSEKAPIMADWSRGTRPLDDIAEIAKTLPFKWICSDDDKPRLQVHEVGGPDLPEYGYVRMPEKTISLNVGFEKIADKVLQTNDLLLTIKGNPGKVGIFPSRKPAPGVAGFVAAQSTAVIRVREDSGIDPRALYMLMRSELVQERFASLLTGSAVKFVGLNELKERLEIPIPSNDKMRQAVEAFNIEQRMQRVAWEFARRQRAAAERLWKVDSQVEGNASEASRGIPENMMDQLLATIQAETDPHYAHEKIVRALSQCSMMNHAQVAMLKSTVRDVLKKRWDIPEIIRLEELDKLLLLPSPMDM
jgi:type I restriction enzyme M protein